jgi:hypothetical protein
MIIEVVIRENEKLFMETKINTKIKMFIKELKEVLEIREAIKEKIITSTNPTEKSNTTSEEINIEWDTLSEEMKQVYKKTLSIELYNEKTIITKNQLNKAIKIEKKGEVVLNDFMIFNKEIDVENTFSKYFGNTEKTKGKIVLKKGISFKYNKKKQLKN